MPEWSEGPERAEAPAEDMDEFRERVIEDHGLEGLEGLPAEEADPGPALEHPGEAAAKDKTDPRQGETAHEEPAELDGVPEAKAPASDQLEPAEKDGTDLTSKDAAEGSALNVDEQLVTSDEVPLKAAAVEAGSSSQNDTQVVVTEHEGLTEPEKPPPPHEVETWDFHHFPSGGPVEQAEEARMFEGETWEDEHFAVVMGSSNQSENQTVVAEQKQDSANPGKAELGSALETPDSHDSPTDLEVKTGSKTDETARENANVRSTEEAPGEDRIIRATHYGGDDGLALRIPKESIPEHEGHELFEVNVKKKDEPQAEYVLYMMHNREDRRGYLDLYQIEAQRGEEFAVKTIAACDESTFAKAFNQAKPVGLENTSLEESCGKILLRVDNYRAPLADASFRTWQGRAILEGTLNDQGLRFVRGTDKSSLRLADRSLVTSIKDTPDGLRLEYTDRRLHDRPHTRYIPKPESALATGEMPREHRMNFDGSGLILERNLSLTMTSVFLQFSAENRTEALRYWNSASNPRERLVHQGDIGEFVAEAALRKSEYRVFEKERFGIPLFHGTHRSERTGADSVFEKDGLFYVGMVKAYANPHTGLKEARADVRSFESNASQRREVESELGKRVSGGLAIEVFWPDKESWGTIYTDYVEYRSAQV